MTRNNQREGCGPLTCEGDPKREGAQGVNGRGTQPLTFELQRVERKRVEVVREFADGTRPAFIATMDIEEWEVERRLIERERCEREIAEMIQQETAPAWLVTLGVEDWKREMEMLTVEKSQSDRGRIPTEANL